MPVNEKTLSPAGLEFINKAVAKDQVREINKELTKLKRISSRPLSAKAKPEKVDVDKTGSFIVVPIGELINTKIEEAHSEAQRACTSDAPPETKKKWFKWK